MCEPTTILAATAVLGTAANTVAQIQQAKANNKALEQQSIQQAEEIKDQSEQKMLDRARAARRERADARVAGSESGINLGSGTFEALLADSLMQQANDNAVTSKNQRLSQKARVAQTRSNMAANGSPSILGAGLQIGAAGVQGYYQGKAVGG